MVNFLLKINLSTVGETPMRFRSLVILAGTTLALSSCAGVESSDLESVAENTSTTEATTTESQAKVLEAGDSFDVPCSSVDQTTCMTVKIAETDSNGTCSTYEGNIGGRFVVLELEATMPEDADPDFTSPFRQSPWRASTTGNEISSVYTEGMCEGGETILNLMDEFPGYSAKGTAYIEVEDDVDVIHFDINSGSDVRINVASTGESEHAASRSGSPTSESGQSQSNPEVPDSIEVSVIGDPLPMPLTSTPEPQSVPAPADQPRQPEPVIGYTEAPGQTDPYVMDKQIQSCGDISIHQTGTTFFTDGTTGWTEQCANQMGW